MTESDAAPEGAVVEPTPVPKRTDHLSDRSFADFPISPAALQALGDLGYKMATPVQARTIEPALAGRDLIVRAKTGTGKTAAFGVPMIERLDDGARVTQALALAPTRELAVQVAQELAALAKYRDLRITAIYGGVAFPPQEDALKNGSEIVVGTPGRLLDHIRRGNLKLDQVRVVVLDEADEMLSMGFFEDVRKIVAQTSAGRQTMLFSATLDESLRGFANSYMKSPDDIHLSSDGDNVHLIEHILFETSPDYHKARALLDLIEQERPTSAIVFCNTREDVSTVYNYLDRQGLGVEMLSGELPQNKRERVMARIKGGAVQFLVSTDVAARGIDISDLSHVIHYALPADASVYLHRSGRTGRIGKEGTVLVLAGGADFSTRLTLERQHKIKFEVKLLPTAEQSAQLRTDRFARMLKDASGTMAYDSFLEAARAIKARPDADTLIAVALKAFLDWDRRRRTGAVDEAQAEGGEARSEDQGDRPPRRDFDRDRGGGGGGGGRGGDRGGRPQARGPSDRGPGGRDGGRDARRDGPPRDRPRGEQQDRPRDDRPRGEGQPGSDGRSRGDQPDRGQGDRDRGARRPDVVRPDVAAPAAGDDVRPTKPAADSGRGDEEDVADVPTDGGGDAKPKRRRRRRGGGGSRPEGGSEGGSPAPSGDSAE